MFPTVQYQERCSLDADYRVKKQFAEFETKGAGMFFDHHLQLTIPEEREEDDEKVMLTRYTPLGVVGAIW